MEEEASGKVSKKINEVKSIKNLPPLLLIHCPGRAVIAKNSRITDITTQQFATLERLPLDAVHSHVEVTVKALFCEASRTNLKLPGNFVS